MKTSIAILSSIVFSIVLVHAEEGNGDQKHKRPNPAERLQKIDTDGNGSISLAEFQAAPRALEQPDRAVTLFGKIDSDGSGEITKDELAKFASERKQHCHRAHNRHDKTEE